MGYTTNFTTRQGKFKRRHTEVSNGGVPQRKIFATLGATLSRFSVLMDINDDFKSEILLLTRYLLDYFRRFGFIRATHNFAKEANIDLEQPLDGTLLRCWEVYSNNRTNNVDYWTFFWHTTLKELKEHTFAGKALTITTPKHQPLAVDQSYTSFTRLHLPLRQVGAMHSGVRTFLDKGMIHPHPAKRILYRMLKRYFYDYYFGRCEGEFIE
ncbi:unnamed protein product [Lactuca virosa]|uniref:LisH domain-containing protein n=1 Tax=Lactuca virosa TaxID=75947 RepID=A0AAU9NQR9_9ASTR|nr:unnamed protein product [Lactuca virosa]